MRKRDGRQPSTSRMELCTLRSLRPRAALPTVDDVRKKLTVALDLLLGNANLPQQVVGNPTGDMLPKPELFDPKSFRAYLGVAAQRSKPLNFRKKYGRKRDGSFSFGDKLRTYSELKGRIPPDSEAERRSFEDMLFERFVTAVPLDSTFRFFKSVILGEKLITDSNWPIDEAQRMAIEDKVAKTKGEQEKKDKDREKMLSKARKKSLDQWFENLKGQYEEKFGAGSFDDLASVTNDPVRNLAMAVDYFFEREVLSESVLKNCFNR